MQLGVMTTACSKQHRDQRTPEDATICRTDWLPARQCVFCNPCMDHNMILVNDGVIGCIGLDGLVHCADKHLWDPH